MSEKNIQALAIKSSSQPPGVEYEWKAIPSIQEFTKNIIIPEVAGAEEGGDLSTVVSGMPSVFARAFLFKNALDQIKDPAQANSGLGKYYESLIEEWRGLIACVALDYKEIQVDRVPLAYSDGQGIGKTENLYEPAGAFGNMLFERAPLWSEQDVAENTVSKPFIDVLTYTDKVVGGTSPESFFFTAISYELPKGKPFISSTSGRFTDPLKSDLQLDELKTLYGYVKHIISNINNFHKHFAGLGNLQPNYSNVQGNLQSWVGEMEAYAKDRLNTPKLEPQTPEISAFGKPFGLLFNLSTDFFGMNGVISTSDVGGLSFNPKELLMQEGSELAQLDFGQDGVEKEEFISSRPLMVMRATTKGTKEFNYFALPLTAKGLEVFGSNLAALVGLDERSDVKSRLTAVYDPDHVDGEKVEVTLNLVTESESDAPININYEVGREVKGADLLLWPNFIHRRWGRYFLYSELPHNSNQIQAHPFVGTLDEQFVMVKAKTGDPHFISEEGKVAEAPENAGLDVKLHVSYTQAVQDNAYKYEVFESNQPFKGFKLRSAGKDAGFCMIRYDNMKANSELPQNRLSEPEGALAPAFLGVDFGSTNTSIAYYSDRDHQAKGMRFENRRISLLASDEKDNDVRPAVEDEIFFFQNDEIHSNAIKSVLTLHDPKRMVKGDQQLMESVAAMAVSGGFPCFEKNLPIVEATGDRYILGYNRVGKAELIHNMKWSSEAMDKAHKQAYLSSLMLHVYAQLFDEGHEPVKLKWSYPSSMNKALLRQYAAIYNSLPDVCPILPTSDGKSNSLQVIQPGGLGSIGDVGGGNTFAGTTGGSSWGSDGGTSGGGNADGGNAWGAGGGGWGSNDSGSGGGGGWGDAPAKSVGFGGEVPEIQIDAGPIKFDLGAIGNDESMTEACAVANYFANGQRTGLTTGQMQLCFDIGGSTTDITAVVPGGQNGLVMIKQNSVRFAAQRISQATRHSKNFRNVLLKTCESKGVRIEGLNHGDSKYSPDTAPYFFEQVVDRLEDGEFNKFYQLIAAECNDIMSVNLYVTGLIMYYAGQLTYKLRMELNRAEVPPAIKQPPIIKIVFAGKGARIFDWFPAINEKASSEYFNEMFLRGPLR